MATRGRLLEIAQDLFTREGYAGVSRADVARRAGVGMSTVYHHFPEKRDMLLQLIDEWGKTMVRRRAAFDIKIAREGRPRHAARDFMQRSFEQYRKGRSFYRVAAAEAERDPEVRRHYEAARRAITTWMTEMIRLGQEGGIVRAELKPEAAAFLLNHVIESTLTELSIHGFDAAFSSAVLDEVTEMVCWYVLGDREDR